VNAIPDPVLFIGGTPRSGTTLLRNMLNTHRLVAVPDEGAFIGRVFQVLHARGQTNDLNLAWEEIRRDPFFVRWRLPEHAVRAVLAEYPPASYSDLIRGLFHAFAASRGKPLSADKTPRNALMFRLLADMFPRSHFVHVLRDPREVVMSLVLQHWNTGDVAGAAIGWRRHVSRARDAARELGDRVLTLRYENLVSRPDQELRRVCALAGMQFDPAMLEYPDADDLLSDAPHAWARRPPRAGLRRWQVEMTRDDIALIELILCDLMDHLGFERVLERPTRRALLEWSRFRARRFLTSHVRRRWGTALPPPPERLPPPSGPFRPLDLAEDVAVVREGSPRAPGRLEGSLTRPTGSAR
jgi:hypothetical protein